MIQQASLHPGKFLEITSRDTFLAEKMRCEYASGANKDNFFIINDCAFMVMGENVSLCGRYSDSDLETILSFCHFMGVYGLETDRPDLPINSRKVMNFMVHSGRVKSPDIQVVSDKNIYEFSGFCAGNFYGTDFDTVYSYFARKVNKGFSHIYYIENKGKILSGGLCTNYGARQYLTFVSTDKNFRRQGYAGSLIDYITAHNCPADTVLMCENHLVDFYQKHGYKKEREIYLYILREEKI